MSHSEAAEGRSYAGKSLADRRSEQLERLLLAARDVFALHGYAGAGVDEIVARAHVSKNTFYVNFENKEECLLAVFELGVQRISGALLEVVAATAGIAMHPAERIEIEMRALAAAFAADPAMAQIMLIGIVGATPALERARMQARDIAAQVIEAQLSEYGYWRRRPPEHRRIASQAAMAAIVEPISDLVASGRIAEWETLVGPVSEFVGRALIDPGDLA
jgi:AcrR family transcriptional regulator